MKLAKREKYLVSAAACCVALFLLFQFMVFPFFENRTRILKGIKSKEKGLQEIIKLRAEYQTFQKASQGVRQTLSRRKKGFPLFSFLEEAAGKTQIKAHIKYMKPSTSPGMGLYKESMVEMKLEGVTLEQLVGYLYNIESPNNLVNIKRISIGEDRKQKGYLDAIIQVLTFQ